MVKKNYTPKWKSSTQPRKQRKFRHNAPLHQKQKLMHAHLSPELRKKYGWRAVQLRTGDKIKIMRGSFAKKEGKVERIDLKQGKVFITGIEIIKKDGTKLTAPQVPSNLMILELDLNDRRRKEKLDQNKNNPAKRKTETKHEGKK